MEPLRIDGEEEATEAALATLLDALPQIVWTCDACGGNEIVNRRWAEFTGRDAALPLERQSLIHPEDRNRTLASWRQALASGEPYEADFRLRRHDGAWRWQLARASPQRDAHGRIQRWIGTVTDIEAQFRAVHESATDGFMLLQCLRDESGRISDFTWVYVNPAASRLTGRSRDSFTARRLLEELPGHRDEGLFAAYVRVVETGESWTRELVYARDGLGLDLRISVSRVDDGVAVLLADLSERRRAERQLRRLQARQAFLLALNDRLRALAEPGAAMSTASEMLAQQLAVSRCGYAEVDEARGDIEINHGWSDGSITDIGGRYRMDRLGARLFAALRAGQTLRIEDTLRDPRVERRAAEHGLASGGVRASIAAPLNKGGRLVGILFVHEAKARRWTDDEAQLVREVAERTWAWSERARAMRALQQGEERLRLATEGVGLGTWDVDLETEESRWSESMFRMLGYAPQPDGNAPPGTLRSRIHPDDIDPVTAEFERLRRDNAPYRPEFRILRADTGEERWIASFGRLIAGEAGGIGAAGSEIRTRRSPRIVGVSLDITERKRLEAERESLLQSERAARGVAESATRAKDEFLATLSHELRTPLSVIISWARVLQRKYEAAEPGLRRGLKAITDSAFAQSQLITDLLDMSRIVSGKLALEVRPVELLEIVADAVDAQAPAATARGVSLRLESSPGTPQPGRVLAEAGRIHQVLGNLLSNAIKFTPAGGAIVVSVSEEEGGFAVTVRDTGEGIDADFLPYLFSRFRQADAGAARRHGGLGLGLSVVHQLVEMHGGSVAAHSDGPGRGATFTVRLPRFDDADSAAGPSPGTSAALVLEPQTLVGLRVLAVEDEPSMLEYLARVLEEHGAQVIAVQSASAALEALRGAGEDAPTRIDLLVSDIGLPGLDGHELARTVRGALGLGPSRLGALALTAFAREEDRRRCLDAGYQAHLAKPYQVPQLIAILRQIAPRA